MDIKKAGFRNPAQLIFLKKIGLKTDSKGVEENNEKETERDLLQHS